MSLTFEKVSLFDRGILFSQLTYGYSRIQQYDGLKKIVVGTNSNLVAPLNYESVGFKLCQRRKNESDTSFAGDYLNYEMLI